MADIELVTLGRLALWTDGEERTGISSQPVRAALLVYLGVEGEATRDEILACIWPEYPADRARRALNQAVYQLRQDLGEDWLDTAGSYRRRTEALGVDAVRFAEAVQAGDYERALELYEGPFLHSCHLTSSTGFRNWTDRQQHRLDALHRVACEGEIERLTGVGDLGRALDVARTWTAMSPEDDAAPAPRPPPTDPGINRPGGPPSRAPATSPVGRRECSASAAA